VSVPLACLLGFAAWTVALLLAVGGVRVLQILRGEKRPSEFPAGVPHGGDAYWRLNRAHLNCVENLPLFGAVVLTGAAVGAGGAGLDRLAQLYLAARVAQSVTHVSSGSDRAVQVRFGFFALQLVCLVAMGVIVARHG
jgi:uncharacterized MAPEG superfamily protein